MGLMNKEKLHTQAIELMEKLNQKYNRNVLLSLDEYFCEYEFTQEENDEIVKFKKLEVHICNKSIMYLLGTTIDWKEDIMGQSFTFDNPVAKNSCGCGSSFNPL